MYKLRKKLKHTDETKRKISKTKKRLFAEGKLISYMKNKHHSEETKRKMSENAKINLNYGMKGKHHLEETKRKMSLAKIGDKNPMRRLEVALRSALNKNWEEVGEKISTTRKKLFKEGKLKLSSSCFEKGHIPWSKGSKGPMYGKYHKEETKKKMSLAHIGIKFSEEHKKKLKETRKYQILPKIDTSIEVKIQNFLKQLNIEFYTHFWMNIEHGYQCDIFIPSMKLIIECFGDYWHKIPYGREIDNLRCQELRDKGFKVLVFWEREIKKMELIDFKGVLYEKK